MQRAALPEDIAEIAALLVASKYLTGEIIVADGRRNLTVASFARRRCPH